MQYNLSTFLKSLNFEKKNLMTDPEAELPIEDIEKAYSPFVINRCFSYFADTILAAQEMNLRSTLDKRMQYDYYLYSIRKRKRFASWEKAEKPEDLDAIKEYFGFSNAKAREALKVLTEQQIEDIKKSLDKGGLKKKVKR